MRWIRRHKSSSLGMPTCTQEHFFWTYSRRLKHLSLGMTMASLLFINNYEVVSFVTYINRSHDMYCCCIIIWFYFLSIAFGLSYLVPYLFYVASPFCFLSQHENNNKKSFLLLPYLVLSLHSICFLLFVFLWSFTCYFWKVLFLFIYWSFCFPKIKYQVLPIWF